MIDTSVENFTAQEAIESGLIEAIERGETKIEGNYLIEKGKGLKITQRKFGFTDEGRCWRVGKFASDDELFKFWEAYEEKNEK